MKNLIFNAFAYISNAKGSENFTENTEEKLISNYLKLIYVSLKSSKINNPSDDVAIVTNINIPENFNKLFSESNIKIIFVKFDKYLFDKSLKWNLAFYKLCALDYLVNNLNYDKYLLLDSDTYVQRSLESLWTEADKYLMLYDIQHSLKIKQAINMNNEYKKLYNQIEYLTNYGGEFICGNKSNIKKFVKECEIVYNDMIANNITTEHGDEFITCCAALNCKKFTKNAGAYVYRFWTDEFYLVSTNYMYNEICILHLPNEKNRGLINIFYYIIKKNKLPNKKKIKSMLFLPKTRKPCNIYSIRYFFKTKFNNFLKLLRNVGK